jgi:hypothetical protein
MFKLNRRSALALIGGILMLPALPKPKAPDEPDIVCGGPWGQETADLWTCGMYKSGPLTIALLEKTWLDEHRRIMDYYRGAV